MSDFPIFTSHIIVSPAYLITRETIPVIFRAYRDENTRCDINFRILKIALQLLSNVNKFGEKCAKSWQASSLKPHDRIIRTIEFRNRKNGGVESSPRPVRSIVRPSVRNVYRMFHCPSKGAGCCSNALCQPGGDTRYLCLSRNAKLHLNTYAYAGRTISV